MPHKLYVGELRVTKRVISLVNIFVTYFSCSELFHSRMQRAHEHRCFSRRTKVLASRNDFPAIDTTSIGAMPPVLSFFLVRRLFSTNILWPEIAIILSVDGLKNLP